jgi:energy-converting hydrogenase A subunit R
MDKYNISEEETVKLKALAKEVSELPMIAIPEDAVSVSSFSEKDQETVKRLDEIFWQELSDMESGRMLAEVNPVGGTEKARSVEDIVRKTGCSLRNVMYSGDSITDEPALKLVKDNGGLAVSFNGNSYSIRESNVAVLSGNTVVTSVFAEVFSRLGKDGVMELVNDWSVSGLEKYCADPELRRRMLDVFGDGFPQVEEVTSANMDRLIKESSVFRKTVRGEAIGKLG